MANMAGEILIQWMLDLLHLQKGSKILDVGCGSGKQCFSFYKYLQGEAEINGGDVNRGSAEPGARSQYQNWQPDSFP